MVHSLRKKWKPFILIMFLLSTLIAPSTTTLASEEFAETLSEEVIIEDVRIPMSDGVELAARVYRPNDNGKYPVLLSRTPYNSGAFNIPAGEGGDYMNIGTSFTKKGYAVVVSDVRGRYASKGIPVPFKGDDTDGNDTIEWIAEQDWSNQKVGMFGASARGMTQTSMMDTETPYLKAMFVVVAPSQFYEEVLLQGGALRQEGMQVWLASQNLGDIGKNYGTESKEYQAALEAFNNIPGPDGLFWHFPLKDFPTLGEGKTAMPLYQDIFKHYVKDGYFDYMDIQLKHPKSNIPAYHVGAWYDIFRDGTVNNFVGLQENGDVGAKGNQKLLMGPWQHREAAASYADNPYFFNDEMNIDTEMQRWFDYWLLGIDNGIMDEKPVRYFNMGTHEWRESDTWPIDTSSNVEFFLNKGNSGTADSLNDGVLSMTKEKNRGSNGKYIYDPNDPTITVGGNLLYPDINVQNEKGLVGPMDQREAEKSSLTYTTEVLDQDVNVTGNITAAIYASSNRKDTDFVVRLTDVSPDGKSTLITDGIIRARFRYGQDKEVFMEPGKVYPFEIKLGNTSHTFKEGHRIRIAIASSNFPHFDRNTNSGKPLGTDTAKDIVKAHNTIYLNDKYPSHITLSIVQD